MGDNGQTRWWLDDRVGTIVVDNPPMNVLTDLNRRGIRQALEELRRDGVPIAALPADAVAQAKATINHALDPVEHALATKTAR